VGVADSWWGFKEGMLKMSPLNEVIPEDVIAAANMTEAGIVDGSAPVFAGPILNQAGEEKAAAGTALDDKAILSMDWYVEGVQS
jgi:simple sugar transport system substrate-binding protein